MSHFNKIKSGVFMVLATTSLSGCISLLPNSGPPPVLINLEPQTESAKIISSKVMIIDEPTCPIIYDGTKIILQKTNETGLTYFTYAQEQQWTERLPKMLQRTMINHFKSTKWPSVTGNSTAVLSDYRLTTDVRKFHIISPRAVDVSINLTLMSSRANRVILTQTFNYVIPSENNVTGYMKAFEQAVANFLSDSDVLLAEFIKE